MHLSLHSTSSQTLLEAPRDKNSWYWYSFLTTSATELGRALSDSASLTRPRWWTRTHRWWVHRDILVLERERVSESIYLWDPGVDTLPWCHVCHLRSSHLFLPHITHFMFPLILILLALCEILWMLTGRYYTIFSPSSWAPGGWTALPGQYHLAWPHRYTGVSMMVTQSCSSTI